MRFVFCILLFLGAGFCHGEVPELFRSEQVNPQVLAEAVNHFVALGKKRAAAELVHYDAERACWVCRLLFQSKESQPPLDMPKTNGRWKAPYNQIPDFDFPTFPVATKGHSNFIVVPVSEFGGFKESVKDFVARYRKTGVFRSKPIPVPTRAQVQADAQEFRKSDGWIDIHWDEVGPKEDFGKTAEAEAWKFVQAQVDSAR